MEREASEKGFRIHGSKIPITLTLERVEDLKPHEEIVEADLAGIIKALGRDPVLRHPIIADSQSGAVLDGTHRLAALSRLGACTIPTALIDYQNPLVRLEQWYRVLTGLKLENFANELHDSAVSMSPAEAERSLQSRKGYAALLDKAHCLLFSSKESDVLAMCRRAFDLERIAREKGMRISYVDTEDAESPGGEGFVMSTVTLDKSEVVASCLNHVLFPPKSTRHLIPSRPLGTNTPLQLLKDNELEKAERTFELDLQKRGVKHLPEGSWVGSRRYMEEVFLFD